MFIGERSGQASVNDPVRDALVVIGGSTRNGVASDCWRLTFGGTPRWEDLSPIGALFPARYNFSAIYDPTQDRIVIFGGATADLNGYSNETWALSLSGAPTWTKVTTTGGPPAPRSNHTAIYDPVRGRMWVYGGFSQYYPNAGTQYSDVWSLDLATNQWVQYNPSGGGPFGGSSSHSGVLDAARDRMLVFGGSYTTSTDVWALSLGDSPAWSLVTVVGTPAPARFGHGAILDATRDRMVVFGGLDQLGSRNDSWALSLSDTPTWSQLVPSGSPPGSRGFHSAIYDPVRGRMVTFGGYSYISNTRTPLNETWALSLSNPEAWQLVLDGTGQPYNRMWGTAVRDPVRDRLLCFGGQDRTGFVNQLWALPLGVPTGWTLLVPTGTPPSPRADHSTICDPIRDRLIVFGGRDPNYLNDTWTLDLPTLEWHLLTPSGTPPSARAGAAVIYDAVRDRMIVFGGDGLSGPPDSKTYALSLGASPAWSTVSYKGTPPVARYHAAAIYDPPRDRLVVFGGQGAGSDTFVYARPLASNGTWARIAAAGPPDPAQTYVAVYDPPRDRMVTYYGVNPSALSLATPAAWNTLQPGGPMPPWFYGRAAAYDASRERMVILGGSDTPESALHDAWYLDWSAGVMAVGSAPAGRALELGGPWPNPTLSAAIIPIRLAAAAAVRADVFDLTGRRVRELTSGKLFAAGPSQLRWDGCDTAGRRVHAGIYMVRVVAGDAHASRKIAVVE
jgi:hypothetical protein